MKFTEQQIKNWHEYENIRAAGEYNMFDHRARSSTNQSAKEWVFNMDYYSDLKSQAMQTQQELPLQP